MILHEVFVTSELREEKDWKSFVPRTSARQGLAAALPTAVYFSPSPNMLVQPGK